MSVDISVIAENLTELLQNTVNMTSVFYDIFLNPEPMDVELEQYDNNGQLVKVSVPNRAKATGLGMIVRTNVSGNFSLSDGTGYAITLSGNTTFVLPTVTDLSRYHKILVQLKKTSQTVTLGTDKYFNNVAPSLSSSGMYDLTYEYDNNANVWVVDVVYKGTV